jgi:hypothetical protein
VWPNAVTAAPRVRRVITTSVGMGFYKGPTWQPFPEGSGDWLLFPAAAAAGAYVALWQINVRLCVADVPIVLEVSTGAGRTVRHSGLIATGDALEFWRHTQPPPPSNLDNPPHDAGGLVYVRIAPVPRELELQLDCRVEL